MLLAAAQAEDLCSAAASRRHDAAVVAAPVAVLYVLPCVVVGAVSVLPGDFGCAVPDLDKEGSQHAPGRGVRRLLASSLSLASMLSPEYSPTSLISCSVTTLTQWSVQ